jgi:3-oxoacyl-[acyl-carrier-protein] synthase-3
MPAISINNVRIAGIAAAVPPLEQPSWEEIGLPPDAYPNARRRKDSPYRRKAKPEQCQSDFCVEAAKKLLADLAWSPDQVDVVVMATLTADYPIPATAIIVQDRLGIPKSAVAFDLPSGPIGFLHAMQTAASMIGPGFLKKALVLAGQVSKTPESCDGQQPFQEVHGHSGSVCALEFCPGSPAMYFDSGGDGSAFASLYMPVGGVRNPPDPAMFSSPDGVRFASDYVLDNEKLAGMTLQELPPSIHRVLQASGKTIADMDGCYFNPMTLPVEDAVRRSLAMPRDKFHSFIHDLGSSASGAIPLAMLAGGASRLRDGRRTSLLGAIGAGLAWGSAVVTTDNLVCPDLLEL